MGEEIGLVIVYCVFNQFDDVGIVICYNFEGGKFVFELIQQYYYDYLICFDCGKVIEFSDDLIELCQCEIVFCYGICLINYSLYLYGYCVEGDCCEDEYVYDVVEK